MKSKQNKNNITLIVYIALGLAAGSMLSTSCQRRNEVPTPQQRNVGVERTPAVDLTGTERTTKANNSDRNVRDRNDATLTPFDQGSSKADTDTTAKIRKEINATDNMSLSAKNVKIITLDGRVTLRGPVDSAEEKRLIGEIANRIARSENVDNQLEVKTTVSRSN